MYKIKFLYANICSQDLTYPHSQKKEPVRSLFHKRNLTGSCIFSKVLFFNPFHVGLIAGIYLNIVTCIYKQRHHNGGSRIHSGRLQ